MNQTFRRLVLALSNYFYSTLLRLFPREFQQVFGPRVVRLFRESCRDAVLQQGLKGLAGLWLSTLSDFTVNLVLEWIDTLHKQRGGRCPALLIFLAGLFGGYVAVHVHNVAGLILLLLCAGFLGWLDPRQTSQNAILFVTGVPFAHLVDLITNSALPCHIYLITALLALVSALVGAYIGAILRTLIQAGFCRIV